MRRLLAICTILITLLGISPLAALGWYHVFHAILLHGFVDQYAGCIARVVC